MTTPERSTKVLSTGSVALDRILGGGLPWRSLNVVAGEPGAGKTILVLQLLFHAARQGLKCLYLSTLSEPSLRLISHLQQFAFFDEALVHEGGVVFADIGSTVRRLTAAETLAEIVARVDQHESNVVVIDSFKALENLLGTPAEMRTFVYDLAVHMSTWGATSLLVGEYTAEEIAGLPVFAIADGILRLSNQRHDLRAIREVEVLKLRGANAETGVHFFEIGRGGLSFFPRVRSPEAPARELEVSDERATTGSAGLDQMLGGGLPRNSATVIQGGTGTGKTLLGLQYLINGARLGEPGIHFTFEETVDQLRRVAHGFGWGLGPLEDRGLFKFSYVSPVELSTESFLHRARQEVERHGARRVVLDSLTSMSLGVSSERRFKELVYALTKHLHVAGVTLIMNMEVADLLGSAQLSGHGVSFAADNVIQLKYVEVAGHLERAVAVLKARGVHHATDARRLVIGDGQVDVKASFEGLRGVLTGLPIPLAGLAGRQG